MGRVVARRDDRPLAVSFPCRSPARRLRHVVELAGLVAGHASPDLLPASRAGGFFCGTPRGSFFFFSLIG